MPTSTVPSQKNTLKSEGLSRNYSVKVLRIKICFHIIAHKPSQYVFMEWGKLWIKHPIMKDKNQ